MTGELAAALRQAEDERRRRVARSTPERARRARRRWSQAKKITARQRQDRCSATLVAEGGDPAAIVEREGLAAIADGGELEAIVAAAIEANPDAAEQIRAGNAQGDRRRSSAP